jgi:hypothetical protein
VPFNGSHGVQTGGTLNQIKVASTPSLYPELEASGRRAKVVGNTGLQPHSTVQGREVTYDESIAVIVKYIDQVKSSQVKSILFHYPLVNMVTMVTYCSGLNIVSSYSSSTELSMTSNDGRWEDPLEGVTGNTITPQSRDPQDIIPLPYLYYCPLCWNIKCLFLFTTRTWWSF